MSSRSRLPDDYSKRASSTCHSADFTGSSWRQQSSDATNKKLPSSKCQGRSRFSDKSEEPCPFAKPYIDRHIEPRGQVDDEHVIKLSSGSFPKPQVSSKVNTETDIVRHMKNLPSYLHPVEKPKNVQDRALNFGVLDWKRLEKWRDKETMPKKGESRASSRVNSMSRASETPALCRTSRHKKHGSVDLHVNPLAEETLFNYAQHSQEKVQNVRDSQNSGIGTVFGKHTELPQKMKLSSTSLEVKNDEGKRIDRNQRMALQKECLPQSSVKSNFRIPSVPISELQGEKSRDNDSIKLGPEHSADEPQDIVLLVPNASRRSSSKSHHSVESKRLHDGKSVEKDQKSHSCRYSSQELQPGKYAEGLRSDVCTSDFQNDMRRSSVKRNSSVDYSFAAETCEEMDSGTAEKAEVKSRPQSPSRRFSFNLGKIGRSFSFRESSTVSKDNSKYMDAKSGPISSESLSGIADHNREKAPTSSSSLGWSSSFRKILNPVLKPKAAHSAQASHSNLVVPEATSAIKLRRDVSNFQALVQLTFKNQLPCFRFVAGNSCNILTACIKDLPTKTDGKFSYSFYSVTEVKKKSTSWIGHGSKEKLCGFDHTALCEMKISTTCSPSMVTEYVLYGVRVGKGGDLEVLLNREIGAIVLKEPSALAYGSESDECCKHIESDPRAPVVDSDTGKPGETENSNTSSITVILPGAIIHGLPNIGAPSSLIDRWKSGGMCDCGGWDMGCKLRVLVDQKEESDCLSSTNICSLIDRVDISKQEDGRGKKQAILCVAPFRDGYYSVNYDSSISQLEAFGICVAVLTSERLSDILDVNLLLSSVKGPPANEKEADNPNIFHSQVPAKYFSSPPTSPAGRI